ncbi:STAS domain-containing protein [Methanolobus vulcani]|jgi:rsbT antagonist protein RsbS|uniref:STAS domain-containing protein n=1 Tax=Methanolobus vulcani TaxID=38026 RepID=A0A7Z8KMK7_9EURY|nr:STAS domain-containing protein [Methanolobus vulcani]TQD24878.1 STAS domain-containing protein [Methanolobus vulcani]
MQIPILKLKNILLTSIQSDMTDDDALKYQSDVVSYLEKSDAKGLIIDITAMDIVDSFMARVINETARMARLMGAKVVLCGMQPMVALTLVEMGRELIGVETALNLDKGFDKLLEMITEGVDDH